MTAETETIPDNPPFVATCSGRRCYHSRQCYIVTRSRGKFRPVPESSLDEFDLPECEICETGPDWSNASEHKVTCPHCGRECEKLGNHLPCDGNGGDG